MTKISVIIPTYHAALFIQKTLASVANQTKQPSEVFIIDDGSIDETCSVVDEFSAAHPALNIRLIRESHQGPGAMRNVGIKAATSEWLAFLDSDDIWYPEKLEIITKAIAENPACNFFCHNEQMLFADGSTSVVDYSRLYSSGLSLPKQLYLHNLFSTSAVVCRRSDVLDVNGFDENLSSTQDYELWLRMSLNIAPHFIHQVLGIYAIRPGNISSTQRFKRLMNIWRVMIRHRSKAGNGLIMSFSLFRLTLLHLLGPFLSKFKKLMESLNLKNAPKS